MIKFVLLLLFALVRGDIYLHNPRGSNNRLNGNGVNTGAQNRLFDSQNNAKGGYCISLPNTPMSFYEGSVLSIEWTNQHSCGDDQRAECNLVLQYMCTDKDADPAERVRDGVTNQRVPDNLDDATAVDDDDGDDLKYGMHESYSYYQNCKARERNKGLFIADQNIGNNAQNSRQDQAGRRGFECPEEKHYYPYWHPTPWRDIAVLTNRPDHLCKYFQDNSQNVLNKGNCSDPEYNNKQQCLSEGGEWSEVGAHGLEAPECLGAPFNRDNHLGNAMDGYANTYNWTLPRAEELPCVAGDNCACTFRIRYNVSTHDYEAWGQTADGPTSFLDSTSNDENSPVQQDPYVMINGKNLSLALNTDQYGRTFEDRSHTFYIRPRPEGVPAAVPIYNLNVRGKRGNIVQAYPAVEYDFVPNQLDVLLGEYVHFQWTGCDNNPGNNAGEGTAKTDRSNIVQLNGPAGNFNIPMPDSEAAMMEADLTPMFDSVELRDWMAHLGQTDCPTLSELLEENNDDQNQVDQDEDNCFKLNAAPRYFDGGLVKMNQTGSYQYMSTRNNNFTNRSQKGTLTVGGLLSVGATVAVVAGSIVAVTGIAAGGAFAYGKTHPHSRLGGMVSRH